MNPFIPDKLPLSNIDWPRHVRKVGQANAELARYDGILRGIVNPAILLSPMTTQEAVLSSRIEGTQASLEEVLEYKAEKSLQKEPEKLADIQEIMNYRKAMGHAVKFLKGKPVCLNLFREIHKILLTSVRGKSRDPGNFRRVQNFIGPPGCTVETATFVPPSPAILMENLDNWEKYLHVDERDYLVQLAVAKAQFEIIHPFLDGNGRIGRMLVPLYLFSREMLGSPMFYISAYFEKNREEYYEKLKSVSRDRDWNQWIDFFLSAVIEQARLNSDKAQAILKLYEEMKYKVTECTHSQYAIKALDAMFDQPVLQTTRFVKRSKIPKHSAMRLLKILEENKIITTLRKGTGRRPTLFAFAELINLAEGRKVV